MQRASVLPVTCRRRRSTFERAARVASWPEVEASGTRVDDQWPVAVRCSWATASALLWSFHCAHSSRVSRSASVCVCARAGDARTLRSGGGGGDTKQSKSKARTWSCEPRRNKVSPAARSLNCLMIMMMTQVSSSL